MNNLKNIVTFVIMIFAVHATAQETQNVTEISIVEDSAPDNIKVNGENTSVYQI